LKNAQQNRISVALGSFCFIVQFVTYEIAVDDLLTLSPPKKLSSAKLLICFNFQSAAMLLKIGENVCVSNSLDPDETRRLIRIQAVCMWHFGCAWRAKD